MFPEPLHVFYRTSLKVTVNEKLYVNNQVKILTTFCYDIVATIAIEGVYIGYNGIMILTIAIRIDYSLSWSRLKILLHYFVVPVLKRILDVKFCVLKFTIWKCRFQNITDNCHG